eukprot:PhM_4_TR11943/c0_g1_i1/m.35020
MGDLYPDFETIAINNNYNGRTPPMGSALSYGAPTTPAQGGVHFAGALRELLLLVYVDDDPNPVKMTVQVEDSQQLASQLQSTLNKPVTLISYWDHDFAQFVPLRSLDNIVGNKAKLQISSAGSKSHPVSDTRDPLEYNTIREYVEKLSPPGDGLVYAVRDIQRLQNPHLEVKFTARRQHLVDSRSRTQMAFYTNNARPGEVAMREGFLLPSAPGPYGKGIVFSSDLLARPTQSNNIRFLVCEVATGKTVALHDEEDRGVTREILEHMGYDSVVSYTTTIPGVPRLEEFIVYHPDQAIPRYVVTCDIVKGLGHNRRGGASDLCAAHAGEILKLWCLNCRELVCAFCVSTGSHKGHDCRSITEIMVKERDVLQRVQHTLDQTLYQRQSDLAELEKTRARYNAAVNDTQSGVRDLVNRLRALLDAKEAELVQEAAERGFSASQQLDLVVSPLQSACAQLMQKAADLKDALDVTRDGSNYAKLEFLRRVNDLHAALSADPRYDDAPDAISKVPNMMLRVDAQPVEAALSALHVDDTGVTQPDDGDVNNRGLQGPSSRVIAAGGSSDSYGIEEVQAKLRAVESGYIWVIPNVTTHLAAGQSRDIFSDPFLLMGEWWEIKITPQPADHMSVFLHAVKHTHRMNFKVFVFSEKGWYARSARNWGDEFRGRGWGIKPFIERRTLLDEYCQGDMLKLCVVPIGGLY